MRKCELWIATRDRWLKKQQDSPVGGYGSVVAQGDKMMREIGHFIGGKAVKGSSGRFGDVFDPNTGEVQAKVALASRAEVEQAIVNAAAAQLGWAATNPQRRARVLFKFLELMQKEIEPLAKLLS